jgi:uncharacterized protein (UPF0276 family)
MTRRAILMMTILVGCAPDVHELGEHQTIARGLGATRWAVELGGAPAGLAVDPFDDDYLARLAQLVSELEPAIVSDHLCWARFAGRAAHDLWPVPYTEEALAHVAALVAHVQDRIGRRILLENPSSYVTFAASQLTEPEFLAEVARRAD